MTVVETINNTGITVNDFFDVTIYTVNENREQTGILFAEERVSKEWCEVFIPKEYRYREVVDYYKGYIDGDPYIAIAIRDNN